jgi:hypothetical protein
VNNVKLPHAIYVFIQTYVVVFVDRKGNNNKKDGAAAVVTEVPVPTTPPQQEVLVMCPSPQDLELSSDSGLEVIRCPMLHCQAFPFKKRNGLISHLRTVHALSNIPRSSVSRYLYYGNI